MRRNIVLLIFLSIAGHVFGQFQKVISLRYSEEDFNMTTKSGYLYISSNELDYSYEESGTHLMLPYVYANIIIGANEDYINHTYSATELLIRSNVAIAPYSSPLPTNIPISDNVSLAASDIFSYGNYENGENLEYVGTSNIGGFRFIQFKVFPFNYDPSTKELYLKNEITINLSLSNNHLNSYRAANPDIRNSVRKILVNKSDLDSLYPKSDILRANTPRLTNDFSYDYIIVTCDSLKERFQRLADWKTRKGVRTKIITVEDIYANVSGTNRQMQIKQALKNYYDYSDNMLQYVLLGGDNEIVPTINSRFHRTTTQIIDSITVHVQEHPNIASDMYYACFSTMNWDVNGDGIIEGEVDNINYSPDIIVTRLSVNSISDTMAQIERIIEYEQNPRTSDWEDNILLSGLTLNDVLYGEERLSNTHIKCEQFFYPNYIQNSWPNGIKYMFYDTGTSFEGGRAYQFRTENFQEQLSQGYTFIFVETHGLPNSWKMEWRPEAPNPGQLYYSSDALQAYNIGRTIITTSACLTNAFDSIPTSLSEAFMRNPEAGILAYYGSTHYGWYYNNLYLENPTARVVGKFYQALLSDSRHQVGRAVYTSKLNYLSDKWHLTSMNALCDPEMQVFIAKPKVFNDIDISVSNGSLIVTTGEQNCRICMSSYNDYGNSDYMVSYIDNSHIYGIGDSTYYVCITKPEYIPYCAIVGNDVYVQNETYNSDFRISGRSIIAGQNVTPNKPEGSVVLQNGKTKMHAIDDVTLMGGFVVELGAELEISVEN